MTTMAIKPMDPVHPEVAERRKAWPWLVGFVGAVVVAFALLSFVRTEWRARAPIPAITMAPYAGPATYKPFYCNLMALEGGMSNLTHHSTNPAQPTSQALAILAIRAPNRATYSELSVIYRDDMAHRAIPAGLIASVQSGCAK